MSLEHAHERVAAFLQAFCDTIDNTGPQGDTDAVSFLDAHVLTATDLRTLLDATAPIMPGQLGERYDALDPWAKRELRAALALRDEQHAEARAAEIPPAEGSPGRAVFWRGTNHERHYLPDGAPVTFILSGPLTPARAHTPADAAEHLNHEVRVQVTTDCLLVTTPSPARVLGVAPMSRRAICITAEYNPTPPSEAEGFSTP